MPNLQTCITHLQNLIRINTVNPPGNELKACQYLAKVFDEHGISYQILESTPGRANIVARIKGDGSKKPLLLSSHLDVVSCETDKWSVDPFAGIIKDDMLWGRGATDMKQMTAMELSVFLKAHEDRKNLKRDIIFLGVADEEQGCDLGSKWMVKNHPELIQAEYALNEVGGFSVPIANNLIYPIGVAEKGVCWFKLTAQGDPGHGSIPHNNQALIKLNQAIQKLVSKPLSFKSSKAAKSFIDGLAKLLPFPKNILIKGLKHKTLSHLITKKLITDKSLATDLMVLFHNTITPTIINAGNKVNVIPSQAELKCDGRIIPGCNPNDFLNDVRKKLGPDIIVEPLQSHTPNQTDFNTDFYRTLCNTLIKHDPEAKPLPILFSGFTDGAIYAKLGIKTYGFTPMKLPKDLHYKNLLHSHNERIPLSTLDFGLKVLWDVILETCYEL